MALPLIIAAAATALVGAWNSAKTREEQKKLLSQYRKAYGAIPLPSVVSMEVDPKLLEEVYPKDEIPLIKASAIEDLDPTARNAQLEALARLGEQSKTGYTAEDRLREEQARRDAEIYERTQRAAVLANMAQRGIGGSGQELALRSQAQQGAADRAYMTQLGQAAAAQQRALSALKGYSGSANILRGQQASEAQARDAISKFNAQQKAQYMQNLLNQRMAIEQYNKQLQQQNFQNQLAKTQGVLTGTAGMVDVIGKQGAEQNRMVGNVAKAGSDIYTANQEDQNYQDWQDDQAIENPQDSYFTTQDTNVYPS